MQITGEKHLINNTYISIIVNKDKIVVEGDDSCSLFDEEKIESEFEKLSKEEAISKVIKKFITGNSVGGIIHGCNEDCKDRCIVVSTDERTLIVDTIMTKENTKLIYEKYNKDRRETLKEKNHRNYSVKSRYQNSTVYKETGDTFEANLSHNSCAIPKMEKDFLREMVTTIFDNEIIALRSKYTPLYGVQVFEGYELISIDSGKKIKIDNIIFYDEVLHEIIKTHNKNVKNNKVRNMNRQLKMKGF